MYVDVPDYLRKDTRKKRQRPIVGAFVGVLVVLVLFAALMWYAGFRSAEARAETAQDMIDDTRCEEAGMRLIRDGWPRNVVEQVMRNCHGQLAYNRAWQEMQLYPPESEPVAKTAP